MTCDNFFQSIGEQFWSDEDSDGDSDGEDFFYGAQVSILPNNLLEMHAKPDANLLN